MRVYIAGPYSGDKGTNVRTALKAANDLRDAGFTPFCPHLSHFWELFYPRPYDDWLEMDLEWLGQCEALVRLPGYSFGADGEVSHARRMGIPIYDGVDALLATKARENQP